MQLPSPRSARYPIPPARRSLRNRSRLPGPLRRFDQAGAGADGAITRFRITEYLRTSLWFVPILCVIAGIGLSFGTIAVDRLFDGSLVPRSLSGDPTAALAILTTVAASMVTLTGLVLTITMVVVQLAMAQFTPRVLRTILRDRPSQLAIGVFVATFAHSMLVMREVKAPSSPSDDGYVPGLAIIVAFVLIIISIMVLVSYVHHIGQSLRVSSLIDSVGEETRKLLDELYPARRGSEPPAESRDGRPDRLVAAPEAGVIFRIDTDELVETAEKADVLLRLVPRLGDFVPEGATLFEVHGRGPVDDRKLTSSLAIGKERTLNQDLAYGFRMLVDVAERSVSEAMGDPTTAAQAIDRLHDCLRQLAVRPFPSGRYADGSGRLRLQVSTLAWGDYVRLAVDELRHYGGASLQISRRLQAMLEDLLSVAPPERRPPLERQLRLLGAAAERNFEDEEDVAAATEPDQQGIGSRALTDTEPVRVAETARR